MKIYLYITIVSLTSLFGEEKQGDIFSTGEGQVKVSGWPKMLSPTKKQLKKFHATDLSVNNEKSTVYVRFLWEPTFDNPLLITASKSAKGKMLSIKKMSGKGGYDWGNLELDKSIKLTDEQWERVSKLYKVKGARKPSKNFKGSLKENFVEAMSGLDGSRWYLEVKDKERYTVEGLPNPIDVEGKALRIKELNLDLRPYVEVCKELLKLSKIKVDLLY